ncbi:MAG: 4-hydroxyphenylacetate 3-hydroxylase C-terminal domain-containing protein, partial [Nocardioidaceae bacterium]
LYTGRVHACSRLPEMMHLVRDLSGCQISLAPSKSTFEDPDAGPWLQKYFRVGDVEAEERRKLLAFSRDLLNSDYANHRLTFQLFAQSPPFSHLLAVYNNYDFEPATDIVRTSANISSIDGREEA